MKYVSLFPTKDDDKSKERREQAMAKVLQIASVKKSIKERDLIEELEDDHFAGDDKSNKKSKVGDEIVFGKDKDVDELDPFFVEAVVANNTQGDHYEKRAVLRDGRVPKFQKNVEKLEQKRVEQ